MTVSVFSLFIAVFSEVGTTLALRMASVGSRLWWIVVGVGYIVAFAAPQSFPQIGDATRCRLWLLGRRWSCSHRYRRPPFIR